VTPVAGAAVLVSAAPGAALVPRPGPDTLSPGVFLRRGGDAGRRRHRAPATPRCGASD